MKSLFFLFLLLCAFALVQMSFFAQLFSIGFGPYLIAGIVLCICVFEREESFASMSAALFGGFLIDIFSGGIIGVWSAILFFASLFIKIMLEDYVRLPIPKKF